MSQLQKKDLMHKVLITVEEGARPSLKKIAAQLKRKGLKDVETFQLGGVIAGEATNEDLAGLRAVPGVASIEADQNLRAI